jgi:hypothetical protein
MSHRHPTWLALAAGLACLSGAAQSQSSYTMTTLGRPAGTTTYLATSLDNAGVVRGTAQLIGPKVLTICSATAFGYPCLQNSPRIQEATWPATVSTQDAPVLGTNNFGAVVANDNGLIAGMSASTLVANSGYLDFYVERADAPVFNWTGTTTVWNYLSWDNLHRTPAIKKNGVVTKFSTPPMAAGQAASKFRLTVAGLNNNNVFLVNMIANDLSSSNSYLLKDGKYTKLGAGTVVAGTRYFATAINDQGDVFGQKIVGTPVQIAPVRWINGLPQALGGAELDRYMPVAVNKSGQALLFRERSQLNETHAAALWSNGTVTPITPAEGLANVFPTAMNNRGDVVGCGDYAFIWSNGLMRKLEDLFPLPPGNRLTCPTAINDKGAIVVAYMPLGNYGYPTWVRLNPQP